MAQSAWTQVVYILRGEDLTLSNPCDIQLQLKFYSPQKMTQVSHKNFHTNEESS